MVLKLAKYAVVLVVVLGLCGGLMFGTDLVSYVRSSARSIRTSVKDSVPVEFELRRARDLLDEIIPEMHANIRLIAKEEVEVANLHQEIEQAEGGLVEGAAAVRRLTSLLATDRAEFSLGGRRYDREAVKGELSRRFERHKEAEVVLAGKRRLLAAREKSLRAAMELLEKARGRKAVLADRIESLAAQHRLVQAAAVGSRVQVDNSKLAQTEKLIQRIKTRLDVAERVLAHEGRFVEPMAVDVVDEQELVAQVNEYFGDRQQGRPAPGEALADKAAGGN